MRNEFLLTTLTVFVAACNAQLREGEAADASPADAALPDSGAFDAGTPSDGATPPQPCARSGECALAPRTCCGVCGQPAIGDMVGLRWDRTEAYRSSVCGGGGPVPCPACAAMENPHLTATCRAGTCAAIDVRTDETSACTNDADCMLRYGTGCCEPCGEASATRLTAFRKDAFAAVVRCLPNEGACPPCVATYPLNARAACNAQTKHCEVTLSP